MENMSAKLMTANSGLLGVALVVRSKDGPRFVFHYPPRLTAPDRELPRWGTELDPTTPEASEDEENEGEEELEEGEMPLHKVVEKLKFLRKKKYRHVSQWDGDDHFESEDGVQMVPWEHLDAFHTKDLASILTPARAYHKKRFALSLDPVYYVTYPMHIREDGRWKKAKKQKKKRRDHQAKTANGTDSGAVDDKAAVSDLDEAVDDSEEKSPVEEGEKATGIKPNNSFASDESDGGGMTMFNMVFIMNHTKFEAKARNTDMYEHVAKDMNKALRFAQHYSNYVWKESEMILGMKEKAREERRPQSLLWKDILSKSSLAVGIKDIYEAISNDKIATVRFNSNPPVRLSVQIPKPYSLSSPPDDDELAMPGLWITSANVYKDVDNDDTTLSKHFALLLLDDEAKIIADIQADGGELANPLLEYLKIMKPTMSFQQTAQAHGISLSDIRILAQHLIYYRRAMAILPLHGRNFYVLSPNSDNHKLPEASLAWRKSFPLAPPLTTFLARLSATPIQYKSTAPSKSHRPLYLDMLAWLVRGGWVTQLRSFAWIIVWPEIRYEVHYALDSDRIKKAHQESVREAVEEARSAASEVSKTLSTEETAEKARVQRAREKAKQDVADFNRRPKPEATPEPSTNSELHVMRMMPTLITDPHKVNYVNSLYLEAIEKRFKDEYTRTMFRKLRKYFNGEEALENIALNEGMKRKEIFNLLVAFDEFLLTTRHW